MDPGNLSDGLMFYLGLVALLTFHEFAHAWVAWLCGDDTARMMGRLSLNPVVHIDPIGTVAIPLLMIFVPSLGGFMVGWAKPVPISLQNLRNPLRDDILIALAGPAMNFVLAIVLVLLAWVGLEFHSNEAASVFLRLAQLSLLLCFFNLIPLPPLDGSHVMRGIIGMSWETYMQLCRYGFIAVLIAIRIPAIQSYLQITMHTSLLLMASMFGPEMREIVQIYF